MICIKKFGFFAITALAFTSIQSFACDTQSSVSISKGSSGYAHLRAGVINSSPEISLRTLIYVSNKSISDTKIDGMRYSTNRLGVEFYNLDPSKSFFRGLYLYNNETDSKLFNKEGVGVVFGLMSKGAPIIQPFIYGEFNYELLSTSWDKVELEYNLQAGIDYNISKSVLAGFFFEYQGYGVGDSFNSTYSSSGIKLEVKM